MAEYKLSKNQKAEIRQRMETFITDLIDDNVTKIKIDTFLAKLLEGDAGEEMEKQAVIDRVMKLIMPRP